MSFRAAFLCIVMLMAANPLHPQVGAGRPGKEFALPQEQVMDTFFAYVIGIIGAGVEVELTNSDLREILTEFKSSLELPFDLIETVNQRREPGAAFPDLGISFNAPVKIPIPFGFLGYHPGSINASQEVFFSETRPVFSGSSDDAVADTLYVMRLSRGEVLVDVDDWLEWLLPSLIQDTIVETICIFHRDAQWYCLLTGTGRNTGDPIRQFFDFTKNRIVYPISQQFRELGERMANAGPDSY